MNKPRTSPQVSVEDLLCLKRAERPAPNFWQHFDRELRAKQLAAIVEPRPWWAPLICVSTKLARYQLPVGATAVLALTFLTVREYRLPEATDLQVGQPVAEVMIDTMPGPAVAVALPTAQAENVIIARAERPLLADASNANQDRQGAKVSSLMTTPDAVSGMVPILGVTSQREEVYSPAARAIAANLEAVKANAPELAQLLARVAGFDIIINSQVKAPTTDPLTRVKAGSDSRRSARLLASAMPTQFTANEAGNRPTLNRVERSLTEGKLYDSISRIGLTGSRVAFSF